MKAGWSGRNPKPAHFTPSADAQYSVLSTKYFSMMTANNSRMLLSIVPAIAVGGTFELFLGHRHDYAGHFLAGYGGSLAAYMVWLRMLPPVQFRAWSVTGNVPLCLGCIVLGACAEATIFRLAKFDELDFCNQSLGAVLAALAALSFASGDHAPAHDLDYGLIAGIAFLGAGGCFAVA
jgi:hypothetical protein